jgi:hypothetical protein
MLEAEFVLALVLVLDFQIALTAGDEVHKFSSDP